MTREELLVRIKGLQEFVPSAKTEEEQSTELEQLLAEENQYRNEIAELEQKLSKEDNYKRHTAFLDEARFDNLKSELNRISNERDRVEAEYFQYESRLVNIDSELEAAKFLIKEGKKENKELEKLFTSSKDEKYNEQLTANLKAIEYLETYIEVLKDERETLATNIKAIEKRQQQINEREARYNALVANFEQTETVDRLKQEQDRKRLNELRNFVSANANKQAYLTYDFSRELIALTEDLENDRITNEEALVRLTAYQNRIPTSSSEEALAQYEELQENRKLQAKYEKEIAAKKEKLANDENYLLSLFVLEQRNADIKSAEARLSKYSADIATNNSMLTKYQTDIADNNSAIAIKNARINELHEENIRLGVEFRRLGATASDADLATFRKNLAANNKEIKNIETEIAANEKEIATIEGLEKGLKEQNKQLKSRRDKLGKMIEKRKENPEIDTAKKYADQQELVYLEQGLVALKNREKYLDTDFETELSKLITDLEKSKEKDIVPLVNTLNAIKEQKEVEEAVIAPVETENLQPEEEKEEIIPVAPILEPVQETIEEPVVEEVKEEPKPEETKRNKIVAWLGTAKATVIEKIKKNWKKYATGLGIGLITAAIIASCRGCANKDSLPVIDNDDKNLENDTTIESVIEEDFGKAEIEDMIEYEDLTQQKSIDEIAQDVIRGEYGNGAERKEKLESEGYDYSEVQQKVNEIMAGLKTPSAEEKVEETVEPEVTPTPEVTPDQPLEPDVSILDPEPEENTQENLTPQEPSAPEYEDGEIIDSEFYPTYPDGDDDFDYDDDGYEPVLPPQEPDTPSNLEEQIITLAPGETLLMPNGDGTVTAVDNSNWENIPSIEQNTDMEVDTDYSSNEIISDVTMNDNGNVDVTIDPNQTTSNTVQTGQESNIFDGPSQEEIDDYNAILEELGLVSPTEEQTKTR